MATQSVKRILATIRTIEKEIADIKHVPLEKYVFDMERLNKQKADAHEKMYKLIETLPDEPATNINVKLDTSTTIDVKRSSVSDVNALLIAQLKIDAKEVIANADMTVQYKEKYDKASDIMDRAFYDGMLKTNLQERNKLFITIIERILQFE